MPSNKVEDKALQWLMDRTDSVGEYVDKLADKLGVAAEHVYGVMVKQQVAIGVAELIKAGVWTLLFVAAWAIIIWIWRKKMTSDIDNEIIAILAVGTAVMIPVTLFTFIWIVGRATDGVQHLMSPEYYALKEIMNFITEAAKGD
jgi:glucan phosphoethanolaminetransferase (alkaline phosphatase superfamily)